MKTKVTINKKSPEDADPFAEMGAFYRHKVSNDLYILAKVDKGLFCLVFLLDGNRYTDPKSTISDVFSGSADNFIKIPSVTITID